VIRRRVLAPAAYVPMPGHGSPQPARSAHPVLIRLLPLTLRRGIQADVIV